jgi:hypothetical protein
MNVSHILLLKNREITVYGWRHCAVNAQARPEKSAGLITLNPGGATFTCPLTLAKGERFTLKETGELFEITSSELNRHEARKIGCASVPMDPFFPAPAPSV